MAKDSLSVIRPNMFQSSPRMKIYPNTHLLIMQYNATILGSLLTVLLSIKALPVCIPGRCRAEAFGCDRCYRCGRCCCCHRRFSRLLKFSYLASKSTLTLLSVINSEDYFIDSVSCHVDAGSSIARTNMPRPSTGKRKGSLIILPFLL